MKAEIYRAAVKGDTSIILSCLSACDDDAAAALSKELLSLTSENNNIIHIATKHGHDEFIREALNNEELSKAGLVNQKNMNGDTPLHVAARHGQESVAKLIAAANPDYLITAQNEDGDTPLHVAFKYTHLNLVPTLSQGLQPLSMLNHSKEAPLHLLVRCLPRDYLNNGRQPSTHIGMLNSGGVSSRSRSYSLMFPDSSESILRHFLSLYKDAACWRDAEGLTPLLRAADFGFFWALKVILEFCPESVDVYDTNHRTVLHYAHFPAYRDLQELLKIPEINALKNVKDCEGNTPAHLAAKDGNLLLLKVLDESMADFSLKNDKDISVEELFEPHGGFFSSMKKSIYNSIAGKEMTKELYEAAAIKGDVTLFDKMGTTIDIGDREIKYNEEYFLSQTPNGSTILHLAIQNGHSAFVEQTLKLFPTLVLSRDINGDTAVHIAARLKAPAAEFMMQSCAKCYGLLKETKSDDVIYYSPWRTKNSKGNIAFHEAMRTSNHNIVEQIFSIDPSLSLVTNDAGETPLHVFARYATYTVEDKLGIIGRMLGLYPFPAFQKDLEGLTPLMVAVQSGRLRVASLILQNCPLSREVRDSMGRTYMHFLKIMHLEHVDGSEDITRTWEAFFTTTGADKLRTAQDEDGNTPLHLALKTGNLVTAKYLMQKCLHSKTMEELTIINNDGCSIFSLIAILRANKLDDKDLKELTVLSKFCGKELTLVEKMMDNELNMAAMKGDLKPFNKVNDDVESGIGIYDSSYFLARTPDGSNIIHIALKPRNVDTTAFVEEALNRFPELILQTDSNGDTPFHLAAKWPSPASYKLLKRASGYFQKAKNESSRGVNFPPWKVRNSKGNMAVHEALCIGNIDAVDILVESDPEGATYVNGAGETPLHVFARCGCYTVLDKLDFLEVLITKNPSAVYMRDNDGLTPLLRAAKSGRIRVAQAILKYCPQSAQLRDSNGRTFLHLLRFDSEFSEVSADSVFLNMSEKFFKIPEVDTLRTVQDYDGNSALQYAMKTGNSITAKILAHKCFKSEEMLELALVNNENERIADLIPARETPHEIVKLFRKKFPNINTSWFMSNYGIRKDDLKESAGSLSVVAALLATITFAAAFQVPGGFNGDDGSPVLLTKAAFQVFLVSDAIGMCSSMVVLYCLLWVMAAGDTVNSFILLDTSIFLLQISFYATLLAFMSGVYVATANKTSWLPIFVCVLCSTVILVAWKTVVIFLAKAIRIITLVLFNLKRFSLKDYCKMIKYIAFE